MSVYGVRVPLYRSSAAGTAQNTFTAERALNDTAMGPRPVIPANFFVPGDERKGIAFRAAGIVSSTATPTFTWTLRLGANASTSAAIIGGTAALTTGSGIANQWWQIDEEIILVTIADVGANSTVRGTGLLWCGGLASPFMYLFNAAASATAPTVATVDWSIANYLNLNITCSASSASNTITDMSLAVDLLLE